MALIALMQQEIHNEQVIIETFPKKIEFPFRALNM
tara:strand:+ start:366 stop:470 length:105 start_codon:yes stop_codon:yes gene_type:complete